MLSHFWAPLAAGGTAQPWATAEATISLKVQPCHGPSTRCCHGRPDTHCRQHVPCQWADSSNLTVPMPRHGLLVWSRFTHRRAGIHVACLFVFPRVGLLVSLLVVSAVSWLLTMMKNLRWVALTSLCTKQAEKPMRLFSFATARNDLNGYQMLEMAMKKAYFPFLNINWKRPAVSLLWQDPLSFLHRLRVYSHTQIDDKKK